MNILTIAYTTEGSTDERFLENIILRTFEDVLMDAEHEIEVHSPVHFKGNQGENSIEKLHSVARLAAHFHVLCLHTDADDRSDERAFLERIQPAIEAVLQSSAKVCNNLVPIVPVQMTEAWMLADMEVLKKEIATAKSNAVLGLPEKAALVEGIAAPKETIRNAIRIACEGLPARRQRLDISQLYTPLSQKVRLEQLALLPSYRKFRDAVRDALVLLNYIRD